MMPLREPEVGSITGELGELESMMRQIDDTKLEPLIILTSIPDSYGSLLGQVFVNSEIFFLSICELLACL